MKRLERYLAKNLIQSVLVVAFLLMSIEMLVVFIGELSSIGKGNYGILQAMRFVLLDMPFQLNDLFPMAGLVGSLSALGLLASQSELIVMQTSGFSPLQIISAILKGAFLIVILNFIIGEVLAPYTEQKANQGRSLAKSAQQALITSEGLWLREGHQFISINQVVNKEELRGIVGFIVNDQQQLQKIFQAERANKSDSHWILYRVKQSELQQKQIISQQFSKLLWSVNFDPKLLVASESEPRNMSLVHLWHYIRYLKANKLNSLSYEFPFWKRLFQPLATLVMIFLAVPFIFGPLRTVTMGLRIVAGISIGFTFYILNQILSSLTALYQFPALLGSLTPILIFLIIGTFFLNKIRS